MEIPQEIQEIITKNNYKETIEIHPIYGEFIANKLYKLKFYDIKIKNFINLDKYLIYITNDKNYPYYLYNKFSNFESKISKNYKKINFKLTLNNGERRDLNLLNIILSSVFYNKIITDNILDIFKFKIDIDHINEKYDDNHENNLITNLRFQCSRKNRQDGNKKALENIEENGGRYGSPTMLQYYNSYNNTYKDLKMFKNINRVSKFIYDNNLSNMSKEQLDKNIRRILNSKINQSNVSNIFSVRKLNENDEFIEEKYNNEDIKQYSLENYIKLQETPEIWKEIPENLYKVETNRKYYVSNYGRVKNLNGDIMRPTFHRYGKYLDLNLNNKHYYIHYLVYITFVKYFEYKDFYDEYDNNENKQIKYVIGHNEKAPLFQTISGKIYYRNFVEDLTLISQSQNVKDWHFNKSNSNELIIITDYGYDYEDSKLLEKIKYIQQRELEDFPKEDDEVNEKGNKYYLYIYDKDKKQLKKVKPFSQKKDICNYIKELEPELEVNGISNGLTRIKNNKDNKYYKKKYYIKDYYKVLTDEYKELHKDDEDYEEEINDEDNIIIQKTNYDYDKDIEYYIENRPKYLGINNSKDRPSKYVISRFLTKNKPLNLTGLGKFSLKIKFLQAVNIYMTFYEINQDKNKIKYDIEHLVSQLDDNEKELYDEIMKL
jgi:hypothetical protein